MTDPRAGQVSEIRTADELRQWLSANRVHGLSAGHCDKRSIEATSLIDGSATSLDVPTDLFRALEAEMVWMHESDTIPAGILLALRSQLDEADAPSL